MNLVPMTFNDLEFLLEVRNDDSTRFFLENDSTFTIHECQNWFKDLKSQWYIILNEHNEKVGYIRTSDDNEVGCDIHPNYRRKGYARKAYLKYLEDKSYASLWVFEDNFAKKLYQEIGFVENGEIKIVRNKKYLRMVYEK